MQPEPRPIVVVDEDDDVGFSDELERRADVASGVVVVRPVPGVLSTPRLAVDVLIAMGKHYDCLSRERQSRHGWGLARLWARAERLRHLVVWDAQRLPPRLWGELAAAAAANEAHLWMVVRPDRVVRAASSPPRCTPADLLAQLPLHTPGRPALLDDDVLLPREGFLTFRWACMQRLRRERFARVDAIYLEAHDATRKWLDGRRWQDRPDREEVSRQLRAVTAGSRSSAETLVRLRAAQSAYFRDGALVQIDEAGLWERPDVPTVGLTPPLAARLRRLVTPMWACALALTAAAGLGTADLARLKVGDLGHDGGLLSVAGESVDVPRHAAGLVRAQLVARTDDGAADGHPLLVQAGHPFEVAPLGRRLHDAARLAGVWRPSEERRPPWERAAVDGYNVRLVALDWNWEGPASA